jgi:glutamate-5-semialdehyde dehydrogenase
MSIDIKQYTESIAEKAKKSTKFLRSLNTVLKNQVLNDLALELKNQTSLILEKNKLDLEDGKRKNLSDSLMDRLELNEKRILSLSNSVKEIEFLQDPVGHIVRGEQLKNGLELSTKLVPLGVVLVIYESRPNVTIDVAALAFKSGNVAILRGGSEAYHTNLVLVSIFKSVLRKNNIPEDSLVFVDNTDRSVMIPLLKLDKFIDLVVPRGGEGLIRFVSENSTIPVVKHDKGVCNLYVDESADFDKTLDIVVNSKLQRPGVCNALENLIIHKKYNHSEKLLKTLKDKGADLLVDEYGLSLFKANLAIDEDYATEFLDNRLSVKFVDDIDSAIEFIEKFSSGHTEAIISNHFDNIDYFQKQLDSAAIFINCSTRFHDGGEFGLGAEVGISTGKLHVRGPMGLMHLTTTTTILRGNGQIRK